MDDETGNYYYGARYYNPKWSIWLSIDPLAEKFPGWSPYAYVHNNPLRYTDPTGMSADDWVDKNGNLIYDTTLNDGEGGYTEHATKNDKHIGDILQSTQKGKEQFNKLVNSKHDIEIKLENGKNGEGDVGKTNNGKSALIYDFKTGKYDGVEVEKSTISIFMGKVDKLSKAQEKGLEGNLNGTSVDDLSFDQILGAVIGHEIEHTTDENIMLQADPNKTLDQIEQVPTQVSDQIIKESRESNN